MFRKQSERRKHLLLLDHLVKQKQGVTLILMLLCDLNVIDLMFQLQRLRLWEKASLGKPCKDSDLHLAASLRVLLPTYLPFLLRALDATEARVQDFSSLMYMKGTRAWESCSQLARCF